MIDDKNLDNCLVQEGYMMKLLLENFGRNKETLADSLKS